MLPKEVREFLISCPIDIEVDLSFVMIANLAPKQAIEDLKRFLRQYEREENHTGVRMLWTRPK